MQQELFGNEGVEKKKGLIIAKGQKRLLSKNQDAFNRLTQKIERLHIDLKKKQLQFDTALKIYGSEIYPTDCRVIEYRRQLVTILWDVYKSRRLSKDDQGCLKMVLREHVEDVCQYIENGPDDALKKMYAELHGESFDKAQQREMESVKTGMQDMFDDLDLDIDLDGIDINDDKAMFEKLGEIKEKVRQREEQEQSAGSNKKKKRSAKQLENERIQKAAEEMKQKNISTIYKQLAKLFHPDLEPDETMRAEKEVLMKELTSAYDSKDLHTLLMLELKWIHKENDHLESLSDEKLAIYLQILREQVKQLERDIFQVYQEPRYQVLVDEFGPQIQRSPLEIVKDNLRSIKTVEASVKKEIEHYQSPFALRYIKTMLKEWINTQEEEDDEDDLMRMIFSRY